MSFMKFILVLLLVVRRFLVKTAQDRLDLIVDILIAVVALLPI